MKGIILLLSLCFTALVYAGNEKNAQKHLSIEKVTTREKIQKPESPISLIDRIYSSNSSRVKTLNKIHANKEEKVDVTKCWLDFGNVKDYFSSTSDTKERLDSIILTDKTGKLVSHQLFTIDNHQRTKGPHNSLWDEENNKWQPVEEYTFVWDEEGYLLEQKGINVIYNEGSKEEFTYDDKKQGISNTVSILNAGQWYPSERGEYKYDDAGNIIEVISYTYNEKEKEWDKISKALATYDKQHRQTSYEEYTWTGTDWDGITKEEYVYNENNMLTLYSDYMWQPLTKDWLYFHKFEQEFVNGNIVLQAESYWNSTENSWIGLEEYNGTVLFTGKTEYKYDEQGREIYEVYSQYLDNGWKKKVDMEDTWSTLENGQTQFMQKTYFYSDDNDTDKYMTGELIKKYNANGDIVYAFEKKIEDGKDSYKYEEEYSYDTDKYLLSSTFWLFDENNAKLADIHEEIVYDDNHNIIDSKYSNGQGTGENDWINISRCTYAYENNVRTEKLAYRWENGDWVTNWGNGVDFDLSVPVSKLFTPIGYGDDYKILATYDYTGTEAGWDINTYTYYYSDQKIVSGINSVKNKTFSVYPNPVVDILTINSDEDTESSLYNLQGSKLLNTSEKKIDMSGYPTGLYIIEVNGIKAKVLKK